MAKSEWGSKRICQDCGAKFYDFARQPITCPKCGAEVALTSAPKPRRSRAAAAKPAAAVKAVVAKEAAATIGDATEDEGDLDLEAIDKELDVVTDDGDDDDALIEDTSDLDDDDDMSDVVVVNTDDED